MSVIVSAIFRLRRDTAANWTATNPVLSLAEPGLETDTRLVKYGDGTTAWNSLAYSGATGEALTRTDDTNVTLTLGGTPATALLQAASITVGWTGILAGSRGGTGNGFTEFSGPASSLKTFTLPNASDTIACLGTVNAFTQRQTITNSVAGQTALSVNGVGGSKLNVDFSGTSLILADTADFRIRNAAGSVIFMRVLSTGVLLTVPILQGGVQVVNTRRTGWTAATGTATRTTFDTATVTLPQLAERMKALLDDLIAHGLIGT